MRIGLICLEIGFQMILELTVRNFDPTIGAFFVSIVRLTVKKAATITYIIQRTISFIR